MQVTRTQIATGVWASGGQENLSEDLALLEDEVADKPGAVVGFLLEMTLVLNSAAGGAGITGRNMFDIVNQILCMTGHPAEDKPRLNNLVGGHCRVLETEFFGVEPDVPADLAAAGGAVTRQLTILLPLTLMGPVDENRMKNHAVPVAMLKKAGQLSWTWAASPSALGGNANDTITSATYRLVALQVPIEEGEVCQPLSIYWEDRNGSNDVKVVNPTRARYMTIVSGQAVTGTGVDLVAGTITQIDRLHVGKNKLAQQISARAWIQQFNKEVILDAASRRVAPDDTASGLSDFFPVIWPKRGGSLLQQPYGGVNFFTQGTQQNFRLLIVELPDMLDEQRKEVLVAMGYKRAAVDSVPAEKRVPKTKRPGIRGHLKMSTRKRALLAQTWEGLTAADRAGK